MPYADPEKRRANQRERTRRYYEAHKDEILAKERQQRALKLPESLEQQRGQQQAYRAANRDRVREVAREWYARNPRKKERNAAMHLSFRHGMRPEDRAAMYESQDGRCCYCERPLPNEPRRVHIDHDHTCTCGPKQSCSFCRRGLACESCNHVLGNVDDDPDRLLVIAANLRRLKAEARDRIAGKPVQEELPINVAPLRRDAG